MTAPTLVGDVIARLLPRLDPAARELVAAAAGDHSDPGALPRAERALAGRSRRPGDFGWYGDTCLQCSAVTPEGSHREHRVATYDPDTRSSRCPGCGCGIGWPSPPGRFDDPHCPACANGHVCPLCGDVSAVPRPRNTFGDALCAACATWTWPLEECPSTSRDPSLSPASSGVRAVGAGDRTRPADAGERTP